MPASPLKDRAFKRLVMPEDFQRLRNTGAPASNRFTRAQPVGEPASKSSSLAKTREPWPTSSKSVNTPKLTAPSTPSSAERTRFDRTRESPTIPRRPARIREPASNEPSCASRPETPSAPASADHARFIQTRGSPSPRIGCPRKSSNTPATRPSRPNPSARAIPYEKLHRPELMTPGSTSKHPACSMQRTAQCISDRRTRPPSRQPPRRAPKPGCSVVPHAPEEPRKEAMLPVHRSNIRRMKKNIQQLKPLMDMEMESVETKQLQLRCCTDKQQILGLREGIKASEKKVGGFEKEMETLLVLVEEEQEKCDWAWWDEGSRGVHGEMQKLQEVEAKRVWDEGDGFLVTESVLR